MQVAWTVSEKWLFTPIAGDSGGWSTSNGSCSSFANLIFPSTWDSLHQRRTINASQILANRLFPSLESVNSLQVALMGSCIQFHSHRSIYFFKLNVIRLWRSLRLNQFELDVLQYWWIIELCTDAAKDMAALTGISEVGKGECDYSGYFPGTSTFQLF